MNARIRDKLKFTDGVMEVKLTAFDMMAMIKQCLKYTKEQKNESYKLIPAALRLDPDEVDKRDTDCNDYRCFQGRQFRVSAKDEAAFEQLRLLKLAAQPGAQSGVVL
ncbi:hypothetical protein OSTOST_14774 [Ostertagia ostertagi]